MFRQMYGSAPELGAVLEELVGAEPVGSTPPQASSGGRAGLLRADTVRPVVVGDEIAARPAQHAQPQLAQQAEHVGTEAPPSLSGEPSS